MKYFNFALCVLVPAILIGCDFGPQSPKGFSLPEGNIDNGKQVFLSYQCLSCHQLSGLEAPAELNKDPNIAVKLGGKSYKVKTYADLLTSVINPSHKIAKGYPIDTLQSEGISKMPSYNDIMTVTELVDLVTFLQSNYELIPYERSTYQFYGY